MCGIAAYIGKDNAFDFISKALVKMEYRGYDSYGMLIGNQSYKSLGSPSDGMSKHMHGNIGIGHTRWATHGEVSLANCHPISYKSCHVVHNGTVANEAYHRKRQRADYTTSTDTEIIACELFRSRHVGDAVEALDDIGSFVAMLDDVPSLAVYRGSNPLYYQDGKIASDLRAFEGEVFIIPENTFCMIDEDFDPKSSTSWATVEIEKESHEDIECYMKHEILSQPTVIKNMSLTNLRIPKTRVKLVACGSSYYACMMAAHFMNKSGGYDTSAVYATEFTFTGFEDAVIFVSQSGETKDVIDALKSVLDNDRSWKSSLDDGWYEKLPIYVLQNKKQSTLSQLSQHSKVISMDVGVEVGVAATKTFVATVLQLSAMGGMEIDQDIIALSLDYYDKKKLKEFASIINCYENALILGSGEYYPIALEGALKFKEVAYIHAEAMPADEIKHGPIALIDRRTISIVIGDTNDKIENNVKQIESRGGNVLRLNSGLWETLVELQHLSCDVALLRGLNPDKPRNLAKTVTV